MTQSLDTQSAANQAEQRISLQLRRLVDSALALNADHSPAELLHLIVEHARALVAARLAVISLAIPAERLTPITVAVSSADAAAPDPPDVAGLAELVCGQRRSLRLSRAELEARAAEPSALNIPRRDWLAAPLIGRDEQALGMIALADRVEDGPFSAEDETLLTQLARLATAALEHAQNYAAEQQSRQIAERARDRIARLQAVTAAFSPALTPDQVATVVVDQGVRTMGASAGAVLLLTDDQRHFDLIGAMGYAPEVLEHWRRFSVDVPLPISDAIRTAMPVYLRSRAECAATYPDVAPLWEAINTVAIAAIPLVIQGRAAGVLALSFDHEQEFVPADRAFMLAIAQQCAQALERTRLLAASRAAEAYYRGIFERSGDAIVVIDAAGVYRDANPAAIDLFGYTRDELLGMEAVSLIVTDPDAAQPDDLLRLRNEGAWRGERVVQRKDGALVTIECQASAVRLPGETVYIAIFRDISERKSAEESLRFLAELSRQISAPLDYQERLERVVRLATPLMADWCAVNTLEADQSIRLLAVASTDLDHEALLQQLTPSFPLDLNAPYGLHRVLRTGQAEFYPEPASLPPAYADEPDQQRLLRRLGLSACICLPLWSRGRMLGALTFAITGSGRRYNAEDLARAEEVAYRVALALDNARLYAEAQSAVRDREELLSIASHDLKNPLSTIKGHAQLMRRRIMRGDIEPADRLIDGLSKIDMAVTRMTDQIDELLDFARLQIKQFLNLDRRVTDLVALAYQRAAAHQQLTFTHKIVVDAAVPELVGHWDVQRLERALDNLLSNAVKYSPNGGTITIRVAREHGSQGAWALIAVQDQGVGIPAADLPFLFERFRRGGNVAGRIKGTGIGLVSARQIIEQHGGAISVESEERVGSTFTVRLPLTM